MNTSLKKWIPLASILSCALFGILNAEQSGMTNSNCPTPCPSECPPQPCPCPPPPCCEPDPCCPRTPAYGYDVPCNFAILHDAGPRVCDGVDIFLTVDFIWWTAREDGLAYAVSGVNATADQAGGKGNVKHPDWEWDPGFKVGAGINLWHDGWDAYAQYTWFHIEGNKSTSSDPTPDASTNELVPTWFIGGLDQKSVTGGDLFQDGTLVSPLEITLLSASGRWDLHLNVIDVEVGRNYFVSRYLTLRPFFGFKGTWQHQDYKVRYTHDEVQEDQTITRFKDRMRQDHDMWGIGIRAGVNTAWHFVREWSVFGDWALTALMSKYDVTRRDVRDSFSGTNFTTRDFRITTFHTENDFYSLKGVLELAIGLRWDVWFGCNDTFHFRLQAAWEEQLWWGQNNMYGRTEECAHGDLMLHGLTIKARFDF